MGWGGVGSTARVYNTKCSVEKEHTYERGGVRCIQMDRRGGEGSGVRRGVFVFGSLAQQLQRLLSKASRRREGDEPARERR